MSALGGKKIVITAGPTREAFDPIRFISNASTGAQGIALAAEAARRGAAVTLILGPTSLPSPQGVHVERVTSAIQMHEATMRAADNADIVIGAAAVCDWRPAEFSEFKLKKSESDLTVRLVRNPDILEELGKRKGLLGNDSTHSREAKPLLVGFAAETNDHEENAREKLQKKHLDAIVVNDVYGERGFGEAETTLTLLYRSGSNSAVPLTADDVACLELGTGTKPELAKALWDALEQLLLNRPVEIGPIGRGI